MKYEKTIKSNIEETKDYIKKNFTELGATVSFKEIVEGKFCGMKYAVLGFERHSVIGRKKSNLNVVLFEGKNRVKVIATSCETEEPILFKNISAEDKFLNDFAYLIRQFIDLKNKGKIK